MMLLYQIQNHLFVVLLVFVIFAPTYCPIGVIAVSAPRVNSPIPTISKTAPKINAKSISAGTGTIVTRRKSTIPVTGSTEESDSEIFGPKIVFRKVLKSCLHIIDFNTHLLFIIISH